jgi:type VI secretion system protein ImpF
MPRYDSEVRITLSVLDRLLDFEPEVSTEPPASRAKTLRQFKQAVKRDLEWLLNTRQVAGGVPEGLKEVSASVAAYGLPDFSAAGALDSSDQDSVRRAIEDAISVFEPRLRDVTVTVEPPRESERALRFRIDASLVVDPAPEPVTFDTTLQLVSGEYRIQEK